MSELVVGSKAPDFSLPADDGSVVSSKSLKGKRFVLYFYPKDDTPGCTVEAQDFRDHLKAFRSAGVEVFGVSKDTVASHCKFRDKYKLTFPLLSDPEHTAIEAFGVWQEKSMYGRTTMGIVRSTFLVGADGKVEGVWRKVKTKDHAEAVLATARGDAEATEPAPKKKAATVAKPAAKKRGA